MKSSFRRELAWICLPLALLIGVGAWVSHDQNERNAEKQRRESGPTRVRVWGIQETGIIAGEQRTGYDYGLRIDGHIEGAPLSLIPGKVWVLRAKSARIGDGKIFKKARIVNDVSPTDGDNVPRTDVWAVTAVATGPREVGMWVYCDSALSHPVLDLELEAVEGTITPRPGKPWLQNFTASGARLVAPVAKIPLRIWNQNDDKSNIIKSEY